MYPCSEDVCRTSALGVHILKFNDYSTTLAGLLCLSPKGEKYSMA